jgi:hypothetical protein
MVFSDEDLALGLNALGRTREAEFLRQWLATRLIRVASEVVDVRALSVEHGRRLLAAELLKAIETPESADARDDLASHVHRPRQPVEYDVRSRRRVPDVAPDDAAELERERSFGRASRRSPRADRRLAETEQA